MPLVGSRADKGRLGQFEPVFMFLSKKGSVFLLVEDEEEVGAEVSCLEPWGHLENRIAIRTAGFLG